MSELEPIFRVRMWLDGDDDPEEASWHIARRLGEALNALQDDGIIRRYELDKLD